MHDIVQFTKAQFPSLFPMFYYYFDDIYSQVLTASHSLAKMRTDTKFPSSTAWSTCWNHLKCIKIKEKANLQKKSSLEYIRNYDFMSKPYIYNTPFGFPNQSNLMSKKGINKFYIYFNVHLPPSLSLGLTRKITFFHTFEIWGNITS